MPFVRFRKFPSIPSFLVVFVVFNYEMVLDFANPHILLGGILNGEATLEKSLTVP